MYVLIACHIISSMMHYKHFILFSFSAHGISELEFYGMLRSTCILLCHFDYGKKEIVG